MSNHQSANPKIVRRATKGSVISTTYEFPMDRKKNTKTLRQMIYDGENGKVLGRTPKNWGELFAFYAIFYIALAALFAICMKVLMLTINEEEPKWKLGESIIGTEPGVAFKPFYPDDPHELIPMIKFATNNQKDILYLTENLDQFLEEYKKTNSNQKPCDHGKAPNDGHNVCRMDIDKLGDCSSENAYGYNNSAPCIFLKLNKIYGWKPECYNNIDDLPSDMPDDLKDHIKSLDENMRDQVWVSCSGKGNGTNIGPIDYKMRGFPSSFYPYLNVKGYMSPIVAVKFPRPPVNQQNEVECRVWAKNMRYSGSNRERMGSTIFSLFIEKIDE